MKIHKTTLLACALMMLAAGALTIRAAEEEGDRWQLITAPFLWGSSIEGDVTIRGDVGGFGISEGETSNFSWQAIGLLGYDLSRKFTVFAGYRALGIDADEGSGAGQRNLDLIFQGLLLGLQVRW